MPAYVADYQFDLFVSYAKVADEEWVAQFEQKLGLHLDRELHARRAASIYLDRKRLEGDTQLSGALTQALSKSALLVIVLSRAYLDRPWCRKEREVFMNRVGSGAGRVFIVHIEDVPLDVQPAELRDLELIGYQFWEQHPESNHPTVTRPLPISSDKFDARIRELASRVAVCLDELKQNGAHGVARPDLAKSSLAGTKVFLADGLTSHPLTKNLDADRTAVRTWLTDHGVTVLPETTGGLYDAFYNEPDQGLEEVNSLLAESLVFVQLLGRKSDDRSYESWVRQRAIDSGKVAGNNLLEWRSPSLLAEDIADDTHRDVVFEKHVIACNLNAEFLPLLARHIEALQLAKAIATAATTGASVNGVRHGLVIVDRADVDGALGDMLLRALEECNVGYYSIVGDLAEFEQMAHHEKVDGVLFVFGKCESDWAYKRFRATRPLWIEKRSRPCIGVLRGPRERLLPARPATIQVIEADRPADIEAFAKSVIAIAQ